MNILKQFKLKYFGFFCDQDEIELFYRLEYSENKLIYLIYRSFMFAYQFGVFLAYYIYQGNNNPEALRTSYMFLTEWGLAIDTTYFTLSFVSMIIGYIRRRDIALNDSKAMAVFRSVTWMVHSVAQTSAICISLLFWALIAPTADQIIFDDPFNIILHAPNSAIFLIEIFVVAFPMRLLHFIYPAIFGIVYVGATLIFYATGVTPAVYPVLDWEKAPGTAVGCSVGSIIGTIVVHSCMFGLHYLRKLLAATFCATYASRRGSHERLHEVDQQI